MTENNRIRTIDSYDKVVRKHKSSETIKITTGICGSKHTMMSGFVFSPKLGGRRQYWVGLKAYDQVENGLTFTNYLQTNAHKHKMRITVNLRPPDSNVAETIQEYDLSGGEGIKYIFFDINRVGNYTVMVENLETGGCEGGKCESGTSTTVVSAINNMGMETLEYSNCWYQKVIMSFLINQDELDKIGKGEPIDIDDINNQLNFLNDDSSGEPEDNTAEVLLFTGLSLSAILLFISFLKS